MQCDKKDFGAISRATQSTMEVLELIKTDVNSQHLSSFNQSDKIIERMLNYKMRRKVADGTRKQSRLDQSLSLAEFHVDVIIPFMAALQGEIAAAFDLTDLPILNAFLKLDPCDLPDNASTTFAEYGNSELEILYEFYGNEAHAGFTLKNQGRVLHIAHVRAFTCAVRVLFNKVQYLLRYT